MPVYIINPGRHLVRGNSRAQALRFVAEKTLKCEVAKGETVADLMKAGVVCEDARTPETAELPLEMSTPAPKCDGDHGGDPCGDPTCWQLPGPSDKAVDQPHLTDTNGAAGFSREAWPEGDPIDQIDTVSIEGIDHNVG